MKGDFTMLEKLKEQLFYLQMKDRWTGNDYFYANELRARIWNLEHPEEPREIPAKPWTPWGA